MSPSISPISRRSFLKGMLAAGGLACLGKFSLDRFSNNSASNAQWLSAPLPPGKLLGPSRSLGHRLRDHQLSPNPTQTRETDVVIVGGGMAGLSAAWWLQRNGVKNFVVLEMENQVGGNSQSGQNAVSGYPWGAHYVPIPPREAEYVHLLFEELGVIQGHNAKGVPIYNELYLCHDPEERLFKDGQWQDGLIPNRGARPQDHQDFRRFFAQIQTFKHSVGQDGKRPFCIPVDASSQDPVFLALDKLSMESWLKREGYQSKLLGWYINYCCRDDYGAPMSEVSAWAGIHYFAARDGQAANASPQAVLTWPQGNGWLVSRLKEKLGSHLQTHAAAYRIAHTDGGAEVCYLDTKTNQATRIQARQVIYAAPRFLAPHLMPKLSTANYGQALSYSPWLVANVTLKHLPPDGRGVPLSWDNVNYHNHSLGYVVATHQNITLAPTKTVITYYRPLDEQAPAQARKLALSKTYQDWAPGILADLKTMHPNIENDIEHLDVWVWGHGMIRPAVGFIWGPQRQAMQASWGAVHFAHSDMSGISVFEEAQYRGVMAAKAVLNALGREDHAAASVAS